MFLQTKTIYVHIIVLSLRYSYATPHWVITSYRSPNSCGFALLSLIHFSIYDLIKRLVKNKEGCWVGKTFYGCIVFADDVNLLILSLRGLQSMLNICNNFADENRLHFNPTKTVCIKYNSKFHPQGLIKQFSVSL